MGKIVIDRASFRSGDLRESKTLLHFRLEKQKGTFKKGEVLQVQADPLVEVLDDYEFRLGFERKKGIYFPTITDLDASYFKYRHRAVVRGTHGKSETIIPFNAALFGGLKVVQTRVGYFNGDNLLDVAYVVDDPKRGRMSYVLYREGLTYYLGKKASSDLQEAWKRLQMVVGDYLKRKKVVPSAVIKKLVAIAKRSLRLKKEDRYWEGEYVLTELQRLVEDLRSSRVNDVAAISILDGFLPLLAKGKWQIVSIYRGLRRSSSKSLAKTFLKIGNQLSTEQLAVLHYVVRGGFARRKAKEISKELVRLRSKYSGVDLFKKIYALFGGPTDISPTTLVKYADILRDPRKPKIKDIVAAEKSIGAKGALLIWKKFKLVRFGRYHASLLKHQVQMAKNPQYDRDKPFVLAVTAYADGADAFYWGNNFKYDPRVRLVVVEVGSYSEFVKKMWSVRNEYGIPDAVLTTNHGNRGVIIFGELSGLSPNQRLDVGDYKRLKAAFKGFFGKKRGFILMNACYAGARPEKGKLNTAQMFANAFNAEIVAARNLEGLIDLRVVIDKNGRARLRPTFFEMGLSHFGFNHGGTAFYPNKTDTVPDSAYNGSADANTGWRVGAGFSVVGRDPSIDIFLGGSYAFLHRLRLRADVGAHFNPISGSISASFDPEVAIGLTNNLLLFGGGRFGATMTRGDDVKPLYQANFGAKILIPAFNGELDIGGASVNGGKPKFFLSFQGRF